MITPDTSRWIAVVVALLCGAARVGFGLLDGDAWATLAGGLLSGGAGVAVVKK